jgi:hypothetical protein
LIDGKIEGVLHDDRILIKGIHIIVTGCIRILLPIPIVKPVMVHEDEFKVLILHDFRGRLCILLGIKDTRIYK